VNRSPGCAHLRGVSNTLPSIATFFHLATRAERLPRNAQQFQQARHDDVAQRPEGDQPEDHDADDGVEAPRHGQERARVRGGQRGWWRWRWRRWRQRRAYARFLCDDAHVYRIATVGDLHHANGNARGIGVGACAIVRSSAGCATAVLAIRCQRRRSRPGLRSAVSCQSDSATMRQGRYRSQVALRRARLVER
jgi:hypothetical protein